MWPKFLLCFFLFCFLIQEIECKSTSRRKPASTGAHKNPNGRKRRPGAGKRRKRPGKGGKRRRKRPRPEQVAAVAGAVAGGAAVGAAVNANKERLDFRHVLFSNTQTIVSRKKPIPTASPSARPSTKADEPEQPLNTRAYWKGPTADPQAKYPRSCQDILVDAAKAPGCKLPEAGKYIIQVRSWKATLFKFCSSLVLGSCQNGSTVCSTQNALILSSKADMLEKSASTEIGMIT